MMHATGRLGRLIPRRFLRPLLEAVVQAAGFSLAEALVAVAILTIAITGLMTTMTSGVVGIDAARRSSTALFLAEQKIEEVKRFALSTTAGQGWANLTNGVAPAMVDNYNTIPGHASYRRTVNVTLNPGGQANTKLVEVSTFWRPVTATGAGVESSVSLSTLMVAR